MIFKNHPYNQFRLGYGHESNGQSVADPVTYEALVSSLVPSKRGPDVHRQALDNISRGWDYLSLSYTAHSKANHWAYEIAYRRYLRWGLLQGEKEEYLGWENPWYGEQLARNEVSGLSAAVEYDPDLKILGREWLRVSRLKLLGTTGGTFTSLGRRGGGKATVVVSFYDIPLTISYASGYDGDIAQYGKINHSWGIGVTLNSFKPPMAPIALTGGGLN